MREKKAVALAIIGITVLATFATLATFPVFAEEPTYEYLIITTEPLSDEFQVLADWKALWVNGAKVETVSPNATDDDIKAVIEDYYDNHSTRYVLLGGDADKYNSEHNIIPCHQTYIKAYGNEAWIAEDYWFANVYGDNLSKYEVYIGRAPVHNEAQAAHFVKKVILFEQMDKPKANLFSSAFLGFFQNGTPMQYGYRLRNKCMQYVPPDYANYTLFEEMYDPVTKLEYHDLWNNGGIMCMHIGHGSQGYYQISFGEQPEKKWTFTDVHDMNNAFWPVHTSGACYVGQFEYGDCLAESFVRADNGAIACFMNNKLGLTGTQDEFIEMQFKALYQDGYQNIGAILAESKHQLINQSKEDKYFEYVFRGINLIGDPETPVLTKRVRNLNLTILAKDQNGTNLATVDVYIDGQWHGLTGSTGLTFTVSPGHEVSVNDFWESGGTGYRYGFTNWEDNSTDKTRTITFFEDTTITAYFNKSSCPCPGDVDGDYDVDWDDLSAVGEAYGSRRGYPNWDSRCDFDCNGKVNWEDLSEVGNNYGKKY